MSPYRTLLPRRLVLCLVVAIFALAVACESSPQDKMREARSAVVTGNADLAETRLTEVLAEDPESFEARRLMASVEILRGEYEAAEESLQTLWQEEGLDKEGDFTTVQNQRRGLLADQFNDLYRRWVEALDPMNEPEEFEEVVLRGLERDGRNTRFNALLLDFYQERADRLVEQNKKVEAAQMLEKIESLRTFPEIRREAMERAENLRLEAFTALARERFEENIQPGLMESDSYDSEAETIRLAINLTVDRGLDPSNEEDMERARRLATRAIAPTIAEMAISLTDIPFGQVELSQLSMPEITVAEENLRRGNFEMTAAIELENLIGSAFQYAEFERTRRAAPDPEEETTEADGEESEGGEQDEASSEE